MVEAEVTNSTKGGLVIKVRLTGADEAQFWSIANKMEDDGNISLCMKAIFDVAAHETEEW